MGEATLERVILEHTLDRPKALIECATVLDIGCGVRPFNWYKPTSHVCVEPFAPYCEVLKANGYIVLEMTAEQALAQHISGLILMLDVIEHMERDVGERVIGLAKKAAVRQVVVYTPNGFLRQDSDPWGYGGHEHQTHRSGWTPVDFPDWMIELVNGDKAFFAVWNKQP